jgi:hypothetical protein
MFNLYDINGLMFWSEADIKLRAMFEDFFVERLMGNLRSQNRAFAAHKCEAPLLTPLDLINPNYTEDDVWMQTASAAGTAFIDYIESPVRIDMDEVKLKALSKEHMRPDDQNYYVRMHALQTEYARGTEDNPVDGRLFSEMLMVYNELYPQKATVLRPETTMGSYAYARHLLNPHNTQKVMPPLVVYQHGKSFRREQDQPTKFMRLKEFYQLEFQILYSTSTKNDYSVSLIPTVCRMISDMIGPCRVEDSDRIPSYAEWTRDVVCEKTNMEVCSISKRTDYENMNVIEVAIGTDRCVYNFNRKNDAE